MNSQDCSNAFNGIRENASSEGVISGSSEALSSSSAFEAEADEAAATPFGLITSNSVLAGFLVAEVEGRAFLMGAGSGFGGMYYQYMQYEYRLS